MACTTIPLIAGVMILAWYAPPSTATHEFSPKLIASIVVEKTTASGSYVRYAKIGIKMGVHFKTISTLTSTSTSTSASSPPLTWSVLFAGKNHEGDDAGDDDVEREDDDRDKDDDGERSRALVKERAASLALSLDVDVDADLLFPLSLAAYKRVVVLVAVDLA